MKIVYDCTLRRPGCALIQAAMGGDQAIASRFSPGCWLTTPTPDMGVYEVTEEQLQYLVDLTEQSPK